MRQNIELRRSSRRFLQSGKGPLNFPNSVQTRSVAMSELLQDTRITTPGAIRVPDMKQGETLDGMIFDPLSGLIAPAMVVCPKMSLAEVSVVCVGVFVVSGER